MLKFSIQIENVYIEIVTHGDDSFVWVIASVSEYKIYMLLCVYAGIFHVHCVHEIVHFLHPYRRCVE